MGILTLGRIVLLMNPSPDIFKVGELIADTYEIRGVLGAGGMGQVFDAHDVALNRRVAIKAHWPSLRQYSLRNEAQALAAVRHPAMVGVYCLGRHDDIEFMVMEHVPGVTLESHLEQRNKVQDRFTPREAMDVLIAVADGLAAVHRAGIAHRDVKPGNILLAPGERIVLTDFGLVTPEFEPQSGTIAGTPLYMAPEAFKNTVEAGASNLLDTYAFGVLAYELLTGELPYQDESALKIMYKHVSDPVPKVVDKVRVPPRLSSLVEESMAKDARDRPQSMESIAGQLRALRSALDRPQTDTPLSVLVVDDTPDIAKLIAMYVKLVVPNAEIQIVNAARAALDVIRKKVPQVMLLDLMMPEMSGVELFMYLRGARLCEDCTVVAVSAGASDADIQLLHDLGVSYFISKGPDLRHRIGSVLKELAGMPKQ